ncbi:MAG: carboxypeptidase-like regulatory domain-containing protein [Candidatus Eremiobacteraeota bacterium]|nr:carboxypeptidase-like regulatory domain-containing protein [Candidatus Eremiobacteraeota bacterium]
MKKNNFSTRSIILLGFILLIGCFMITSISCGDEGGGGGGTGSGSGTVEGEVSDFEAIPVQGALCILNEVVSGSGKALSDFTDEDGSFSIGNVPAGTYSLSIVKEGYQTIITQGFNINDGQTYTIPSSETTLYPPTPTPTPTQSPTPTPTPEPSLVTFKDYSGCNYPWNNYGWDLGENPWGGSHGGYSSNIEKLQSDFAYLKSKDVKIVRIFLFCDFRTGLKYNGQSITGVQDIVSSDMNALLQVAGENDILLIPVLFDYLIADGVSEENGNAVGEHPDFITDSGRKAELMSALENFLDVYGNNSNIYAWEIMNEPGYATAVSQDSMELFVKDFVDFIHVRSTKPVTLGVMNRSKLERWTEVGLDLYQYHYYDSMEATMPLDFPASSLGLDKPVFVGEAQPSDVTNKMEITSKNGYRGILFWSLNGNDGYEFRPVADEFMNWEE